MHPIQEKYLARKIKEQKELFSQIIARTTIDDIKIPISLGVGVNKVLFVISLWPYPQPLMGPVLIDIMEKQKDRINILYDRANLVYTQRKIIQELKESVKRVRLGASELDMSAPDTLGWRGWNWDNKKKCLISPVMNTEWTSPELRVVNWEDTENVRGVPGIHARRLPKDWTKAIWGGSDAPVSQITGVVERFDRFVLGEIGWRAEWVIIRK